MGATRRALFERRRRDAALPGQSLKIRFEGVLLWRHAPALTAFSPVGAAITPARGAARTTCPDKSGYVTGFSHFFIGIKNAVFNK
jgi:hypothetical protein